MLSMQTPVFLTEPPQAPSPTPRLEVKQKRRRKTKRTEYNRDSPKALVVSEIPKNTRKSKRTGKEASQNVGVLMIFS